MLLPGQEAAAVAKKAGIESGLRFSAGCTRTLQNKSCPLHPLQCLVYTFQRGIGNQQNRLNQVVASWSSLSVSFFFDFLPRMQ